MIARGSAVARSASSTFAVPPTFVVNVSTGLSSPRRTSDCAARWNTTSGSARATAARASPFERTSPRTSPANPSATCATSYRHGSDTRSALEQLEIGVDHQPDELLEGRARLPAQLRLGLGRIADEEVHLGGPLERV